MLNIESKYRFLLSYTDFCFLVVLTKCLCHKEVPIYQCNLPTGQKYIAELTWLSFIVSKSLKQIISIFFMAIFSRFHERKKTLTLILCKIPCLFEHLFFDVFQILKITVQTEFDMIHKQNVSLTSLRPYRHAIIAHAKKIKLVHVSPGIIRFIV